MSKNLAPTPNSGIMDISPYVGGKSASSAGISIKLSSNESRLGASPKAQEAYLQAVKTLHKYPDGRAKKLRTAIAEVHNLPEEQLVCGAGSDELIGLLVNGYVSAGDEVIITEYGFLMYKIYAMGAGAKVVVAPEKNTEKNLTVDVDAILERVTEKTKIVFIANPANPTGTYIPASELKRLHAGLPKNVILAIDDAYCEYADAPDYSDGSELVAENENVVMLRTFSKIYGLSALRIGWAFAPEAIIDAINRIRGPFNLSTPAIEAGAAAVLDTEFTKKAKEHNTKWRAWLADELAKLGLKPTPSLANFVLVEFPAGEAKKASDFLMDKGIIIREVANYGLPNHLRITVGLEEDNRAVIAALSSFLAEFLGK